MSLMSFKLMLGVLGNYMMSDRIFSAIDRDGKGKISLEDYLVYNEVVSHGSQTEKNMLTFKVIDVRRRGRVDLNEFKEFWLLFLELCSQVLNMQMPKLDDDLLRIFFREISERAHEFDFDQFTQSRERNPQLFETLE
jgi:Ca2+-binding EF-hand superfamily protein